MSDSLSVRTRVFRLALAWPMVSLGIAMLLRAKLGVAPFDVLNTGLTHTLRVPFAVVYLSVSFFFYAVGAALGGRVGWASLVGILVISPLIGVFRSPLPDTDRLIVRGALLCGATLILALAVSLVISTEWGPGPTEVFMLGLIHRRVPLVVARWSSDGLPLLLGVMIGGSVGVGTVIFGFALGPLIKLGFRVLHYTPPPPQAVGLVIAAD